jgi:hypothetical protein
MTKIWLAAPADPGDMSPSRTPGSIRRTSTIDTQWPDGLQKASRVRARARDLITHGDGRTSVIGEDWVHITGRELREIAAIETSRLNDVAQQLVGAKGGGYLRKILVDIIPDEVANATLLNLLLDDFSGASLVAPWGWSRWKTDMRAHLATMDFGALKAKMEGICTGHAPGSSSLARMSDPQPGEHNSARVAPLPSPQDPEGWHEIEHQEGPGMRRARRMDVRFEEGVLKIDVGFQDSATEPGGGNRVALHEYRVAATADPATLELLSVEADPRVLPFQECPGATPMLARTLGIELGRLRTQIPVLLPGILGCTHLNDVMRSMADVPALARRLAASAA